MNKLLLVFLLVAQSAFAVTGNKVWRIPSGGSLGAWGPVNLADNTNAVTGILPKANLPVPVITASTSSGLASVSSPTYADVTNLSITITSTGRPIMLYVQSDGTSNQAFQFAGSGVMFERIFNSTNSTAPCTISHNGASAPTLPLQSLLCYDQPGVGTFTYKVQAEVSGSAGTINWAVLAGYELQ